MDGRTQHFSITIFGGLRVRNGDGSPTALPCGPDRLAFERLCLHPNRPVAITDLVRACWPRSTPARGPDAIEKVLDRLAVAVTNVAGVALVRQAETVTLQVAEDCMDLLAFEAATSRCLHPAAQAEVAHAQRMRALELHAAGPAYAHFRTNHTLRHALDHVNSARDRLLASASPSWPAPHPTPAPSAPAVPQIVYLFVTADELQLLACDITSDDVLGPLLARARRLNHDDLPSVAVPAAQPAPDYGFSDRELTISKLLRSKMTLPEIARHLSISINTTKTHTQAIYRKLGVSSRAEAAARLNADRSGALALAAGAAGELMGALDMLTRTIHTGHANHVRRPQRPDSECRARAPADVARLLGGLPDDLRWDTTHPLQGHAHLDGRELVVIAPRDDHHQTIVLSAEDWDAVRHAGTDQPTQVVASCAWR